MAAGFRLPVRYHSMDRWHPGPFRLRRATIALRLGMVVALLAVALSCRSSPHNRFPIIVASPNTPEQVLLGKMTVLALEADGYQIIDQTALGDPWMTRAALETGTIDVCWQYSGETWTVFLGHDMPIANAEELMRRVRAEDALNQITWLVPAAFQHSLGMAMRKEEAQQRDIDTVSDLAHHVAWVDPTLVLCTTSEVWAGPSGARGLTQIYGLRFQGDRLRFMPADDAHDALLRKDCDCVLGYAGDAATVADQLRLLEDDRGLFQASNLAPVVRTLILQQFPDLGQRLGNISRLISHDSMAPLLRQIAQEGQKPERVAKRFLTEHGLIGRTMGQTD